MKKKKPSESQVETNHLVLPSHANALGTIFGGVLMSWIDIAAAISAQRHSGRISVTAGVDALYFLAPVNVGDAVCLKARVVYTGRTSMITAVEVTSENLKAPGQRQRCVTAFLSMVAVDDNKKPTPVPELILESAEDKAAFTEAAERRQFLLSRLKDQR